METMAKHTVKQVECTESIACENGLFREIIWNRSDDVVLKCVRKNPNTLLPGDQVHVPKKHEGKEPGEVSLSMESN